MGAVRDLAAAAEDSPRDVLTVQALADALEELGAEAASVRLLTIDRESATMLLLGLPLDSPLDVWTEMREGATELRRQLRENYGVEVGVWLVPAEMTVRQIKINKGAK